MEGGYSTSSKLLWYFASGLKQQDFARGGLYRADVSANIASLMPQEGAPPNCQPDTSATRPQSYKGRAHYGASQLQLTQTHSETHTNPRPRVTQWRSHFTLAEDGYYYRKDMPRLTASKPKGTSAELEAVGITTLQLYPLAARSAPVPPTMYVPLDGVLSSEQLKDAFQPPSISLTINSIGKCASKWFAQALTPFVSLEGCHILCSGGFNRSCAQERRD